MFTVILVLMQEKKKKEKEKLVSCSLEKCEPLPTT